MNVNAEKGGTGIDVFFFAMLQADLSVAPN